MKSADDICRFDDEIVAITDNFLENKCITSTHRKKILTNFYLIKMFRKKSFESDRSIHTRDQLRYPPLTSEDVNNPKQQILLDFPRKDGVISLI